MFVDPFGLGLFVGFVIGAIAAGAGIMKLASTADSCRCDCPDCGKPR